MEQSVSPQTTGKFQDYVSASAIICHSTAESAEAIIHELAALAVADAPLLDKTAVARNVLEREALFPTVIAPGLAMPHARFNNLDDLIVALATSEKGIRFGTGEDAELVHVVALVLSPNNNPGLHLQVVSALAHEFRDLNKVDQLSQLTSVDEIVDFLGIVPMRLSEYLKVGEIASESGPVVLATDSLAFALRKFGEAPGAGQLPVIDENGGVQGVITLKAILDYNLPEGLIASGDLTAIYDFRPYAHLLGEADNITVAELMSNCFEKVSADIPAVQLLKIFLEKPVDEVLVLDNANRLQGIVKLRDFCAKLLWE